MPVGCGVSRELSWQGGECGTAVFCTSEVRSEVEQISDRIGMLVDGKLRSVGPIAEILSKRVSMIEVVARDLPEFVAQEIEKMSVRSRVTEAGIQFCFSKLEEANEVARKIHAYDGTLVEFTPVKESLEDFFVREQEAVGAEA